jgi:RND superfamily putative drug exporter
MLRALGHWTVQHPGKVVVIWLLAALLLAGIAPPWDANTQDDDIRFLPERCACVRGYHLLEQAFPHEVFASRAVFAVERPNGPLRADDFDLVDRMTARLERLGHDEPALQIGAINSHRDGLLGRRLTSADGQCSLIQVSLGAPYLAVQTQAAVNRAEACLRQELESAGPDAPQLLITGAAGVGRDLLQAGNASLEVTTIATVVLIVVVLLIVYRAPLLALVPLVTIGVSGWVALHLLALLTLIPGVHLVQISRVFAIVLLYGAGTDYCLFLISRYREELKEGHRRTAALRRSVTGVGGALTASAGTVICGLSLMATAEFAKVRCAGPAIGLALAVALLASLTLTPALLRLLGRAVFWPTQPPGPDRSLSTGSVLSLGQPTRPCLWDWLSRCVVERPRLVWFGSLAILAPLFVLGLYVTPAFRPTGELSPTSPSIRGLDTIQHHFTAGETGPVTVLLESAADWNTPEGRQLIDRVSHDLGQLDNVAEVRSLTQPLGRWLPVAAPTKGLRSLFGDAIHALRPDLGEALAHAGQASRDFYLGTTGDHFVTRLDVVFRTEPLGPASAATLHDLEIWLAEELPRQPVPMGWVRAECYGVTVHARDLADVIGSDRQRVNLLVLTGIFVILLMVVRRVWLAAYLLGTVLVSYVATLGVTALAGALWWGQPVGPMDWRVPFFLFAILVAVGEDYNILLVTRILDERKRRGAAEGIGHALARTGGTISACGLIMAGTFATLMLGGLNTLVQIGFALSFGVLLDTFLVRPFLVPAFLVLVWQKRGRAAVPATAVPQLRRSA